MGRSSPVERRPRGTPAVGDRALGGGGSTLPVTDGVQQRQSRLPSCDSSSEPAGALSQAVLARIYRRLRAVAQSESPQNVGDVALYGCFPDV
jgi:hypothetical protein